MPSAEKKKKKSSHGAILSRTAQTGNVAPSHPCVSTTWELQEFSIPELSSASPFSSRLYKNRGKPPETPSPALSPEHFCGASQTRRARAGLCSGRRPGLPTRGNRADRRSGAAEVFSPRRQAPCAGAASALLGAPVTPSATPPEWCKGARAPRLQHGHCTKINTKLQPLLRHRFLPNVSPAPAQRHTWH